MSTGPAAPELTDSDEGREAPISRWPRLARRLYTAALGLAAVAVLLLRRREVGDLVAGARPAPLLAALALGLVSLVQSAAFWQRALVGLGAPRPVGAVLEATVAALPARYLPGSVWYAIGRVGRLRRSGSPGVALSVVALLETLLSVAVAVVAGVALLALAGVDDQRLNVGAPLVAAGALGLLTSPGVLNPALRWAAARRGVRAPVIRWATFAELAAHLVAFWAASAAAFLCYLAAFPAVDAPGVARTAGSFLLAWAAGFLAVVAPQGAGVFEATMAGALAGPVAALALVIGGYRALTAVRDAVALTVLAGWRALRARR